jgi:hypothetical protein
MHDPTQAELGRAVREAREAREARDSGEGAHLLTTGQGKRPVPTHKRVTTLDDVQTTEIKCEECNGFDVSTNPLIRCMFYDEGECVEEEDGEKRGAAWHSGCVTGATKKSTFVCTRHEGGARFKLCGSGRKYFLIPVVGNEEIHFAPSSVGSPPRDYSLPGTTESRHGIDPDWVSWRVSIGSA